MVSNNLNLEVPCTAGVMFACGLGLSVSMEEESDHVVSARWGLGVCGFAIGLVQCTYMYLHTRGDVHLQVDIHVVHIYTMSNTKWIHTALHTHTQWLTFSFISLSLSLTHTHTHIHTPFIQNEHTEGVDAGDEPSPLTSDLPSASPPEPTTTLTQQPKSPSKPHPPPHTSTPPPPTVANSSDELISLRQALQAAEEQTQLINDEYRKLLKEKEVQLHMYMYMYMYTCTCTYMYIMTNMHAFHTSCNYAYHYVM